MFNNLLLIQLIYKNAKLISGFFVVYSVCYKFLLNIFEIPRAFFGKEFTLWFIYNSKCGCDRMLDSISWDTLSLISGTLLCVERKNIFLESINTRKLGQNCYLYHITYFSQRLCNSTLQLKEPVSWTEFHNFLFEMTFHTAHLNMLHRWPRHNATL